MHLQRRDIDSLASYRLTSPLCPNSKRLVWIVFVLSLSLQVSRQIMQQPNAQPQNIMFGQIKIILTVSAKTRHGQFGLIKVDNTLCRFNVVFFAARHQQFYLNILGSQLSQCLTFCDFKTFFVWVGQKCSISLKITGGQQYIYIYIFFFFPGGFPPFFFVSFLCFVETF